MKWLQIWLVIFLVGCATNRVSPDISSYVDENGKDPQPIFLPVEVHVWGFDETLPRYVVRDYLPQIKNKILDSGLFPKEDGRPPLGALDIRWDWETPNATRQVVSKLLRAFTLFLIPDKTESIHTMEIDLYSAGRLLKTYRYTQHVQYVQSAFTDNNIVGAKWFHDGVNPILSRFFVDLEADGLILDGRSL